MTTRQEIMLANTVAISFLVSAISILIVLISGILVTAGVAVDPANWVGQISAVVAVIATPVFLVSLLVLTCWID